MASPQIQVDNLPFGKWAANLDANGRIKFSADLQKYVQSQHDKRLYITTVEDDVLTIYPAQIWHHNLSVMQELFDDPYAAEETDFLANAQGASSEMDSQGRVVIPARLREELSLANEQLQMVCRRGRIDVMRSSVFERKVEEMKQRRSERMLEMKKKGFI